MPEEFIDMKGQPIRELEREQALNYNLEQVVADLVDNSIDAGQPYLPHRSATWLRAARWAALA